MKSYIDLEIYHWSFTLAKEVHEFSLSLPKFELYELGSQIRRSSKSIVFNIAEGFGRRRYKKEFISFLIFANASTLEVITQLRMISELYPKKCDSNTYLEKYDHLGIKIHFFTKYVEENWIAG